MARILVTGGTGYIGSHTVVELMQQGYDVVIVDNLSNSNSDVVDGITAITGKRPAFEQVDCNDIAAMDEVLNRYSDIEAAIHFAASKAVGESVEQPLLYYRNNLMSLVTLLEQMKKQQSEIERYKDGMMASAEVVKQLIKELNTACGNGR